MRRQVCTTLHAMRITLFAVGLALAQPALAAPDASDLVAAYPGQFAAIEGNELVWRDGTRMLDDGIADKDFDTLLDHPDIDDMFAMPYIAGPTDAEPGLDQDPGRIRYEPLFIGMYGDCETGEVDPHLRSVAWLKGNLRFTTVNGAADALERVVAELRQLPPAMTKYLVPSAGTYNCRRIAGTERRSMHAYGAGIDISTAEANYWLWTKPIDGHYPYRNRIPFAIIEIFERHGFIWGGKWYHYDTMHFEYRPELLPPASR